MLKVIDNPESEPENVFEVDRIVDHRGQGRTREYLVRWKNYPPEADTWEPVSHFNDNTPIRAYFNEKKQKVSKMFHSRRGVM